MDIGWGCLYLNDFSIIGKNRNYSSIKKDTKGIYIIFNKINNNFYLGSSKNIRKRLLYHFSKLRTNNHSNNHLQSSFDKYGIENFDFDIIDIKDDDILPIEQKYLNYCYKHFKNKLYNKSDKVTGSSDYIITNEFRNKISNRFKGIPKSEAQKSKMRKPVLQYDLEGNFIKEHIGMREAAKELGINHKGIYSCCRKINKRCGNYIFKYKDGDVIIVK